MLATKRLAVLALSGLSAKAFRTSRSRDEGGEVDDCYSPYDAMSLLTLAPCTEEVVKEMSDFLDAHRCKELTEDPLHLPEFGGCAEFPVLCDASSAAHMVERFALGEVRVLETDAGGALRKTSGVAKPNDARSDNAWYGDWRDLEARDARVEAAVAASNGAATIEVAGQSLQGRPIKLVRFTGAGYSPGKPKILMTFNLHAREWITGMAGVYAVEKLAELARDGTFLAGVEVAIMYMANPDGFVHSTTKDRFHRKNMRKNCMTNTGVDLNRNFNISWGTSSSKNCWSDMFHGSGPESEPETKVLLGVFKESPMAVYIDVHSYTQVIMWPWGYTKDDPPRKAEHEALGNAMTDAVEAKHGAKYRSGQISKAIYKGSGSTADTTIGMGALSFAYELRPRIFVGDLGFAPHKKHILPSAEECWEGLLVGINHIRGM